MQYYAATYHFPGDAFQRPELVGKVHTKSPFWDYYSQVPRNRGQRWLKFSSCMDLLPELGISFLMGKLHLKRKLNNGGYFY